MMGVVLVSAINAKTLEVKFNKAAAVTAKDFTVNKGTVKTNIAEVKIAEDQKSAQIELTSKLTEGEYTVSVAQGEKDALTASVKVENEKVAAIEILSDVAPISTSTKATGAYRVLNQYGEDVTKLYGASLLETPSGVATGVDAKADGSLEFSIPEAAKVGDKVGVTLVDKNTGVSATKQLTLSDKAMAAEATFGNLYNKDGKVLSQDTDLTKDKFYLPITIKDQYGKEITNAAKANTDMVITNTNPAVVEFDGAANEKIKEVTIDGKDVLALEVSSKGLAGTANVLAISKSTGKSVQIAVTVKEGVKINSIALSTPSELVTAKKDILFPLTVVDTNGNEVKTKVELNKIKDSIATSVGEIIEVKDKGLFVKVTHADPAIGKQVNVTKDVPVTVVVTTGSGKVATQTVTPRAEAIATVITGINAKKSTDLRAENDSVVIENTDLIVEDQYGQIIKDQTKLAGIEFEVTPTDSAVFSVTKNSAKKYTIAPEADATKTSEKLTFKLLDNAGAAVDASAYTVTFNIVKDSEFASYVVEDVKTVYVKKEDGTTPATHQNDIVVKAKTNDGKTVELNEGSDYTVKSSDVTLLGNTITGVVTNIEENKTTKTGIVTVTINANGEELKKEITFSNVAPKTQKVVLVEDTKGAAYITGDKTVKEVTTADYNKDLRFNLTELSDLVDVVETDQYGKMKVVSGDTLTLTKVSGDVKFSNNGASNAYAYDFSVGDVFNARVNINGVSATALKVTAKAEYSAENQGAADDAAAKAAAETKIVAYAADQGKPAPIAADYAAAEITIAPLTVAEANAEIKDAVGLPAVKAAIAQAASDKAQATRIANINEGNADEDEFTAAGITGVTAGNLTEVKQAVAAAKTANSDEDLTKAEIQEAIENTELTATGAEVTVDNTLFTVTDADENLTAGTTTAATLLGYIEAIDGAKVQVFAQDGTTEKTDATTIAAEDIIVVTAANGTTTQNYTIVFE